MLRLLRHLIILLGCITALPVLTLGQESGSVSLRLRQQSFGSTGEGTYRSATITAKNDDGGVFYVSSSKGDRQTIGAVQVGGEDFEVGVGARLKELKGTYKIGVAFPQTPADRSTSVTYGLDFDSNTSTRLSIRGFTGATAALGLFVERDIVATESDQFTLRVGTTLTGQSTVDEATGQGKRNLLVNARYSRQINEKSSVFLGLSNDLGDTTRFSLNSSVGNRFAVNFGVEVKF